jgi:hypothetical protein
VSQKVKTGRVRLAVGKQVQIAPGVVLPPGTYVATMKETGLETFKGVVWATPQYLLELTAEELAGIGIGTPRGHISTTFDLARQVRSGEIEVL